MSPLFQLVTFALATLVQSPAGAAQTEPAFSPAQLEQLVAPIALHPDALLTQILMASTYPLEIVEAHRFVQKDPKRTGKKLEEALKDEDWDPSVKSLCGFPTVLQQMNDNLDWTQDLGEAFLAQRAELLDTVQRMRQKALESGNLKTTDQQTVKKEDQIIVIASSSPEVVYVPTYSPVVVYGGWYYPSWYYPAWYYPPPPGYGAMAFTAGVVWGAAVWGHCDWHHGDIDIDINRYNEFNRNTNIHVEKNDVRVGSGDRGQWTHDPAHRKGVNYRNPQTAQRFGAPSATRATKDAARGFDRSAPVARSQAAPSAGAGKPSTGAGAFSGSRNPSFERSASQRGAASRATNPRGGGRKH